MAAVRCSSAGGDRRQKGQQRQVQLSGRRPGSSATVAATVASLASTATHRPVRLQRPIETIKLDKDDTPSADLSQPLATKLGSYIWRQRHPPPRRPTSSSLAPIVIFERSQRQHLHSRIFTIDPIGLDLSTGSIGDATIVFFDEPYPPLIHPAAADAWIKAVGQQENASSSSPTTASKWRWLPTGWLTGTRWLAWWRWVRAHGRRPGGQTRQRLDEACWRWLASCWRAEGGGKRRGGRRSSGRRAGQAGDAGQQHEQAEPRERASGPGGRARADSRQLGDGQAANVMGHLKQPANGRQAIQSSQPVAGHAINVRLSSHMMHATSSPTEITLHSALHGQTTSFPQL
ncbi:hypothetical protein ACLOJK_009214 [Asimina triloba]